MPKRFKSKRKKKHKFIKIFLILIIIYISFHITYRLIYKSYLSKLSNQEIIERIILNSKNNKTSNSFLNRYQNPNYILENNFNIKKDSLSSNNKPNDNESNNSNSEVKVDNEVNNELEVYIYSTHETESYSDKYLEVYNITPTVKTMSYILSDYLKDYGINSYVEKESVTNILKKNNWPYKYSYEASKEIIKNKISSNNSLKLIIDLHRDSSVLDKTLLTVGDTKYAKILFVVGLEHDNYESNLKIANKLYNLLEEEVLGITRGISKKSGAGVNGIYNQDLSSNSVLIELGGQYNEIEELNNSLKVLAKVILKYIEGET